MAEMIPVLIKYPHLKDNWDYNKNIIDPATVPCRSTKKYYWICNNGHSIYTIPKTMAEYPHGCPYCLGRKVLVGFNDLWTTCPQFAQHLLNKEDGFKYTHGSSTKKLKWICPICSHIVYKTPNEVTTQQKIACNYCGDGVSYPEKVVMSFLEVIGVNYLYQLTRTYDGFEWCGNFRYDIFLPDYNTIIEVNGGFHYGQKFCVSNAKAPNEVQKIDKIKRDLAINNGISNYISLDCRQSDFDFIKNNIIQQLSYLLGQQIKYCNWDLVNKGIVLSYVSEVCDYYNKNPCTSIKDIAKYFHRSPDTIRNYLERGNQLQLCQFDTHKHHSLIAKTHNQNRNDQFAPKAVRCITTDKVFASIREAACFYNIKSPSNLGQCCMGKTKTCGKYNGQSLCWEFYTINPDNRI